MRTMALLWGGLCGILSAVDVTPPALSQRIELGNGVVGQTSAAALPIVGSWSVAQHGGRRVLSVDGRSGRQTQIAPEIVEAAGQLFGEQGSHFIAQIRAKPDFPLAVVPQIPDFQSGTLALRFQIMPGDPDQAVGIAFALHANGNYLLVRANAVDNNLGFFWVEQGKRTPISYSRTVAGLGGRWRTLGLTVIGKNVAVSIDDTVHLRDTVDEPVSGRVALWARAASVAVFDELTWTRGEPVAAR